MKSEPTEQIRSINEANIGRRLIASILDFLLAGFLWLFFAMIVMTPIANNCLNYSGTSQLGYTYETASHLYLYQQIDENNEQVTIEVKDYTEKLDPSKDAKIVPLYEQEDYELSYYVTHVYYYYTSFLTGENIEMPNNTSSHTYDMEKDHLVSPNYQKNVKDSNLLPKDYYTTKWFNENILKINDEGASYFETSDINVLATVKADVVKADALLFLRKAANNAAGDLYYSDFFQDINNALKWDQVFIVIPPYVLVMCVLYLAFPLLFKNGETLGKKFMHIAIINKNGYSAKKRQIIFRFLVFFFCISLSLFVVGVGYTSIATLGIGILIMFIATLISKTHRAPHDYAAMTVVIDARTSVWFESPEDEEKHNQELKEKMEKYKSIKVENKNIIQVGGTILDENLKKEVEASQAKEKQSDEEK